MAYLFPYAGMENPPKPPKPKTLKNAPMYHPRKSRAKPKPPVEPTVIPPAPRSATPAMTDEMRRIADEVCARHGIYVTDLASGSRVHKVIHARREYCYRCVTELGKSYSQIGRSIGQDHTTARFAMVSVTADPSKMEPYTPAPAPSRAQSHRSVILSDRQLAVKELLDQGLEIHQIAERLGRTNKQVMNDRYEIRCKLKRIASQQGG